MALPTGLSYAQDERPMRHRRCGSPTVRVVMCTFGRRPCCSAFRATMNIVKNPALLVGAAVRANTPWVWIADNDRRLCTFDRRRGRLAFLATFTIVKNPALHLALLVLVRADTQQCCQYLVCVASPFHLSSKKERGRPAGGRAGGRAGETTAIG